MTRKARIATKRTAGRIFRLEHLEERCLLSNVDPSFYADWDIQAATNQIASDRLIVHLKASLTEAQKDEAMSASNAKSSKVLLDDEGSGEGEVRVVRLRDGEAVSIAAALLAGQPEVESVEPDRVVHSDAVPNDPYYVATYQWGVGSTSTTPTSIYGSQAAKAWQANNTGSPSVYVAVIDTGVMVSHEDLMANMWTNSGEVPGNGIDDDADGYVDDVNGYDFLHDDASVYDPGDIDSHGTHVSGIIGAVGNNDLGVVGINWNVGIIPVKFIGPNGGLTSDAIEAIDYVTKLRTQKGLKIVAANNSWGQAGGWSQALEEAVDRMAKADILFVASAGNNGANNDTTAYYPSGLTTTRPEYGGIANDLVMSVAAIDENGNRPSWSNYGATTVDLGAPGVEVLSTLGANNYGWYSGTSMAAPHVTGAAALYAASDPSLTAIQIKNKILQSAVPTGSLAGITATGGRLNVSGAVQPLKGLTEGGFESPALAAGTFGKFPTSSDWKVTGSSGISTNGSGYTSGNPGAPEGKQVAYLQKTGTLTQTVNLAAGDYQFSFSAAQRGNWQAGGYHDFRVVIDGQSIATYRPPGTSYQTFQLTRTLTAGTHTITFAGLNSAGGDNTSFIDNVTLNPVASDGIRAGGFEQPVLAAGTFRYAPTDPDWLYAGNSGVSSNGSGFTVSNPPAPEGSQVAILQGTASFSQTFQLNSAGNFRLSFQAAQRKNWQVGGYHDFRVLLDNVEVGTYRAADSTYQLFQAFLNLSAGSHTIVFAGINSAGGDNTSLIDAVSLQHLAVPVPLDGGFANPSLASGTSVSRPTTSPWTFLQTAGVSANGSGFTVGNPSAPEGTQVAFIQKTGSLSQAIDFGPGGRFAVDFYAAQRGNWQTGGYHNFDVLVDGVLISTIRATDTTYRRYRSDFFTVSAGSHTILFLGRNTAGGDNTSLIDDVKLVDA
jgi:subtilisin family serine protease